MAKSSKRHFLVKVDGIAGYFATLDGGDINADTNKVFDGGALKPDVLAGAPTPDDITCTRPYDPDRDDDIIRDLRQKVGVLTTTVSKTPTDANMVPIRPPLTYSNALLKGFQEPKVDANAADPAEWGLIFAVTNYQ